ncbi:hypothetical protein IF2G_00486 [Cordyceps javanica]|nr:hypothetical protein IF2G_00486 [Cordyceps javanica]
MPASLLTTDTTPKDGQRSSDPCLASVMPCETTAASPRTRLTTSSSLRAPYRRYYYHYYYHHHLQCPYRASALGPHLRRAAHRRGPRQVRW